MKKLVIAGSAIALAAMPVVGVFAVDDQASTDTIQVTVNSSCTFSAGGNDAAYTAAGANGASVNPSITVDETTTNIHTFTVFCNDNDGYTVSATANDLTKSGITDVFAYKATLPSNGADGAWHATIAKTTASLTVAQLSDSESGSSTANIATLGAASAAGGETFTATYTAYIGTETPAETYSGTIAYTLAAN